MPATIELEPVIERDVMRPGRALARWRAAPALLCAAAILVGCASAEDRFEQGVALEQTGQPAAAARRYIQALRKDPSHLVSRRRLEAIGPRAVNAYLAQAAQDRVRGDALAAAEGFLAADALFLATRAVQVTLPVPPNYAEQRRSTLDGAIEHLLRVARDARAQGRFAEALEHHDAIERFGPDRAQVASAHQARIATVTRWAEHELDTGHYRAALERVEQGLALIGAGDHPHAPTLLGIRDSALQRGRVRVAFLALRAAPGVKGRRANDLLAAVNDALVLDHWTRAPPLVEPVDPLRVRRAARRAQLRRAPASPAQAALIAREVGADYAVVSTLSALGDKKANVRERKHKTRTRSGTAATYSVTSGSRRYDAAARYLIVGAGDRRVLRRGAAGAVVDEPYEHADYAGDPATLRLSRDERRRFAPPSRGGPDAASVEQLAAELADDLASHVLDDVVRLIP